MILLFSHVLWFIITVDIISPETPFSLYESEEEWIIKKIYIYVYDKKRKRERRVKKQNISRTQMYDVEYKLNPNNIIINKFIQDYLNEYSETLMNRFRRDQ